MESMQQVIEGGVNVSALQQQITTLQAELSQQKILTKLVETQKQSAEEQFRKVINRYCPKPTAPIAEHELYINNKLRFRDAGKTTAVGDRITEIYLELCEKIRGETCPGTDEAAMHVYETLGAEFPEQNWSTSVAYGLCGVTRDGGTTEYYYVINPNKQARSDLRKCYPVLEVHRDP